MIRILTLILLLLSLPAILIAQTTNACTNFQELIKTTYNFKPSKLSDAVGDANSTAMDKVWQTAKANPKELIPCLRQSLESPGAVNGSCLTAAIYW